MNIIIFLSLILVLIALIGYLLFFDTETMIYISIIAVSFPIHIRFLGKDAVTTGTIYIFILYFKYLLDSLHEKRFIKEKYDLIIYLLIVIGTLSLFLHILDTSTDTYSIGSAVRKYFSFVSSLLLFMVLKNHERFIHQNSKNRDEKYIENLLTLIITILIIHILISISVKFIPSLGSYFNIFLTRTVDNFDSVERSSIERISSFVFSPESYGEILAVISPIVLYKVMKYRNPFWLISLSLICCGLFFTVTRSGIILFAIAFSFSLFYYLKSDINKLFIPLTIVTISLLLLIYVSPHIIEAIFLRFDVARDTYNSGRPLIEIINRNIFYDVFYLVKHSITLFGNGDTYYNFHNLYLTIFYSKGIIGATIYFIVLLYPIVNLFKALIYKEPTEINKLIFACFVASTVFLINELKFEFNRTSSYQQICWALFAVFYLSSKEAKKNYQSIRLANNLIYT